MLLLSIPSYMICPISAPNPTPPQPKKLHPQSYVRLHAQPQPHFRDTTVCFEKKNTNKTEFWFCEAREGSWWLFYYILIISITIHLISRIPLFNVGYSWNCLFFKKFSNLKTLPLIAPIILSNALLISQKNKNQTILRWWEIYLLIFFWIIDVCGDRDADEVWHGTGNEKKNLVVLFVIEFSI